MTARAEAERENGKKYEGGARFKAARKQLTKGEEQA